MADSIQFSLTGLEELLGKLDEVSGVVKYKRGRPALLKAAQFIRDKAKENALRLDDHETAEKIADNIVARWNNRRHKSSGGDLAFRIGVLGGARQYANTKANVRAGRAGETYLTSGDKGNPGGDTFYWRYLEFGTEKMAARPFMRPALIDNDNQAIDIFVTELDKSLARAIKSAKKKAAKGA